jgi:serine/threonine protein kinase
MLKLLNKRGHPHVINLLATFRLKGRYYLLFPYADFNLRQYWKHTPMPDFSETTVSWILHQCKAIASALHMVHEFQSTQDFSNHIYAPMHPRHPRRSDTSDSQTEDEGRRYGRHGDIKAENILWFSGELLNEHGRLVIADFGMTAFHKKASRSKVKAEHVGGSPSYEPPEIVLHESVSRAFDIWSLGCLYLEFVTWLTCGWELLSRFPDARERYVTTEMSDDTFFTIIAGEHRAIVRQGVQDWMNDLHEMPRCSDFVHEFLNLISEHMLVVNPRDRIVIGQLNRKLAYMLGMSRKDPLYLIAPNPYSPRDQQPEPVSLAAQIQTGVFLPLQPTDGTPLLKGASVPRELSPHVQPFAINNTSPPTSPRLE